MYEVQQPELAFCQTEDLIRELLNRTLFVGILVYSEKEAAGHASRHQSFMMKTTPNLEQNQIAAVLETALEQLKAQ